VCLSYTLHIIRKIKNKSDTCLLEDIKCIVVLTQALIRLSRRLEVGLSLSDKACEVVWDLNGDARW
jgi:hypothetical protein